MSIVLADDFKTIDGKEYKGVTVSRVEPDGVVLTSKSGISKVYFTELPKEVQERFHYGAATAEPESAAAIKEREATMRKREAVKREREAAERERAKREQDANAKLAKSEEAFEAAERQATQSHQHSPKGTLSGQIFVATKAGESVKLGAVQVSLFARDAVDVLVAGLKAATNAKIELQPELPLGATAEEEAALEQAKAAKQQAEAALQQTEAALEQARAARQQAEAAAKIDWDAYQKSPNDNYVRNAAEGARGAMKGASEAVGWAQQAVGRAQAGVNLAQVGVNSAQQQINDSNKRREDGQADAARQKAFYYSGSFCFDYLRSPIQTAETDADGKFVIEVPQQGEFVIAAHAERTVGEHTENYYWLQPVSLGGQRQHIQNLSNSNLTTTTGTSSLILTKD